MESFLAGWLPSFVPEDCSFTIHAFRGKPAFFRKVEDRLRGYANWLPANHRLVVVVDRDSGDCKELKSRLENICAAAGLVSRSSAVSQGWQVVTRIAIEELEAWYFGDWQAVCAAYPRVSPHVPKKQGFRDPDAVRGGTWEAFERVMQASGYFRQGLAKVQAAAEVGQHVDPVRNRSRSFGALRDAIAEAVRPDSQEGL